MKPGRMFCRTWRVGPYRLEALCRFRTFAQTESLLQVNSNPGITSSLQVGSGSETIEVQPCRHVENAVHRYRSGDENARILGCRWLAGRSTTWSPCRALPMQTGVATTGNRPPTRALRTFSIAGSLNGGNTVTLDGAMHNDVASNTALRTFPCALQEFKVETSSLPANTAFIPERPSMRDKITERISWSPV